MLDAVARWEGNVHGFFNLVALEIWGRMFVMGSPLDELSDRIQSLSAGRA
jgi:hypothetical protein